LPLSWDNACASLGERRSAPEIMQMKVIAALIAVLALLGACWALLVRPSGSETPRIEATRQDASAEPASTTAAFDANGDAVTPLPAPNTRSPAIDVHAIPLGDGKVSGKPQQGYVYSCQTNFRGGGADHAGDWIEGDTWDLTKKVSVMGSVSWPEATFSMSVEGTERRLLGNGLPVDSWTGVFPIQRRDPAYQYDTNPNSIEPYKLSTLIPAVPQLAANASCVPMGAIGYALNGVAIYNALDDAGRDAVAHEVQDVCDGHPQQAGQYHYHGPSDCMPHADENNALVGYALDGFGIYSLYDAEGNEYADADLDACHGITSDVEWNGARVTTYHYVLTREYPYTIGCFRGTPVASAIRGSQPGAPAHAP
jgi:YHYH protein